jgi:protein-S-isoprenylcysteine O-methyltransferase Ste14
MRRARFDIPEDARGMTTSRSTPRLRIVQLGYAVVIVLCALSDGRTFTGVAGDLARLLGLLLAMAAVLGRLWTTLFIAGRKDLELVTDGPYSLCRNPLYLLSVVGATGIGLGARSVALALALPALLAVLVNRAARAEEGVLARQHGVAYAEYVARVPRFLPHTASYRARAIVDVVTPVYFRAYLDAGAFTLLFVVVAAADTLAGAGILPVLMRIP